MTLIVEKAALQDKFKKKLINIMYFYCKIGKVETNIPWNKPSFLAIKYLFDYVKKETDIFEKYKIELWGKILFNWKTFDVDIMLSNDSNVDYLVLEEDITKLTDICLNKFRLLPDIQFSQYGTPNVIKSEHDRYLFYYKSEDDLKTIQTIKSKSFIKKRDGEDIEINYNGRQITENLVSIDRIYSKFPIEKIPEFSSITIVKEKREDLVYSILADEIISISEEEFNSKTNRFNI